MAKSVVQIEQILQPVVDSMGYELVGCELLSHGNRAVLKVFIDKIGGITLDECAKTSRQLSAVLDVEDPISVNYDLEVSSPGLNRRLFKFEHYEKYVGCQVKIKLHGAVQSERRNFKGLLSAVKDGKVTVVVDDETFVLSFDDIERANLVPEF